MFGLKLIKKSAYAELMQEVLNLAKEVRKLKEQLKGAEMALHTEREMAKSACNVPMEELEIKVKPTRTTKSRRR